MHEKNYSPDCGAGENERKSSYFQCAVHLPVDKLNRHKNYALQVCFRKDKLKGLLHFVVEKL